MEWAIEVAKEFGKPVAATMCIGPVSDKKGVSTGECAVRMCRAGALNTLNYHYRCLTSFLTRMMFLYLCRITV